jgi:hypothetical protein
MLFSEAKLECELTGIKAPFPSFPLLREEPKGALPPALGSSSDSHQGAKCERAA